MRAGWISLPAVLFRSLAMSVHIPAPPTALTQLARYACSIVLPDVPAGVRRQAALCVLDTMGCVLAGTQTQEAALALACEPDTSGGSLATVLGTPHRRVLLSAVRVNAYLGDVLELNDLIGGHASIGNVSAALALAETTGATGADLLEAVVRGVEVTARVYGAVYPRLRRFVDVGMVPVGMASSLGAAAAAARLLDLDAGQTQQALAIAGALAGWCPAEVIFGDGGTVKPMLFGAQTGSTGVQAALYARQGMTGPPKLLDSPVGYFGTVSSEVLWEIEQPPQRWALSQPRRKLHACCGYLHATVDALGQLRSEQGSGALEGVVYIAVPPYVADVVGKTADPISPNDARFHLPYCAALVMIGEDVIRPAHSIDFVTWLSRADVRAAMARVRVTPDPGLAHYEQCRIHAGASDNAIVRPFSSPRGSPARPLSDDEVVDKFRALASPVIGGSQAQQLVGAVNDLPELPDCSQLLVASVPL